MIYSVVASIAGTILAEIIFVFIILLRDKKIMRAIFSASKTIKKSKKRESVFIDFTEDSTEHILNEKTNN